VACRSGRRSWRWRRPGRCSTTKRRGKRGIGIRARQKPWLRSARSETDLAASPAARLAECDTRTCY